MSEVTRLDTRRRQKQLERSGHRLEDVMEHLDREFQRLDSRIQELSERWESAQQAGKLEGWFEEFLQVLSKIIRIADLRRFLQADEVDEFGLDVEFEEKIQPFFDFLFNHYWRIEVKGIKNLPLSGAALMVANHSGTVPYDGAMIKMAVRRKHPKKREVRFLVEDFVYHFPFLGTFMYRIGGVRACPENAQRLLSKGEAVLSFPEGVKGIGKLYRDRYRLQRFGRGGIVRLAMKAQAPIVPVAVVGAEEIHPTVHKMGWFARLLGVPYIPITPTFPLLGPLGLIPLPTKWRIEFGEPIPFDQYTPAQIDNPILINRLTEDVRQKIQVMLADTLRKRTSIWS